MTKYWMTNAMRMAMTANTMRSRKAHCSSVRLRPARPDVEEEEEGDEDVDLDEEEEDAEAGPSPPRWTASVTVGL